MKPPFSNSSGVVWTGPHCHFIAFRWWIVQLVKNFSRQELIERNILSPKNNHNRRLFTIVDFKPSTKISMCLHDPFSYRSLPAFNRIRKGRKYLFPRARFFRLKKPNLFIELIIGNTGCSERSVCFHSFLYFMFKAFYIILKISYFHIQTSSTKC